MPLREDATVYHVLHTVTFATTSATGLLKHASHVSTDRVGEHLKNVITSFCLDNWSAITHLNYITCELSLNTVHSFFFVLPQR